MKFLALAALAVVSAAECTEDELADDANCNVTEGEGDDAVTTCTEVADDVTCDEEEEEEGDEEEEASSALFAGVASAAVAATMMF